MGISSEVSRLVGVLSRSQLLKTFNRPESTLQICLGVFGVLGTVAVLASLRHFASQSEINDKSPRSTNEKKVKPSKRHPKLDRKDADIPIERISTPPPAYQSECIDSASPAMIDEMAESAEYLEEVAQSPSARSGFRKRMKKTFKLGRKNSAQS